MSTPAVSLPDPGHCALTWQKLLPESLESRRGLVSRRRPDAEARDVVEQKQIGQVGCHWRLGVVHQQVDLSRLRRAQPGHLGQGDRRADSVTIRLLK